MLYHLNHEESFLTDLQYDSKVIIDLEAGVREVTAMTADMAKLLNNVVLMEDITVMWQLKEWLRQHPGVEFTKVGKRMPRSRRMELKGWKADVNRVIRESVRETTTKKFMTKWNRTVPRPSQVTEFRTKRQNAMKRKAKRLRKKQMATQFL